MSFVERGPKESLVAHLVKNADALNLTDEQLDRLKLAYRLEIGTWADKIRAGEIAREVQGEIKADLDATLATAETRGEKVAAYNEAGARRIKSRDGFGALHASGTISDAEFAVGMAYRYLFEAQASGLGSQIADPSRVGSAPGSNGASATALFRAYSTVRLTRAERIVALTDRTGRALAVLRAVVGEGQPLTARGGARRCALAALHHALAETAKVFTLTGLRIGSP
jgi:hypothetical protein